MNIVTSSYQICLDAVRRSGGYYMEVLLLVLHGWDSAVSADIYSSVGPTDIKIVKTS